MWHKMSHVTVNVYDQAVKICLLFLISISFHKTMVIKRIIDTAEMREREAKIKRPVKNIRVFCAEIKRRSLIDKSVL